MAGERAIEDRSEASGTYDLLQAWEAEPHAPGTIALCNWLAGLGPAPWPAPMVDRAGLLEFGRRAAGEHASRAAVLLALGRMFLAWRELSASLTTLVRAATLAPHEPLTFRLLGEVLFRRGDPARAMRVLQRAMAGGMTDADTRAWYDVAHAYASQPTAAGASMPSAPPPPFADALLAAARPQSERPIVGPDAWLEGTGSSPSRPAPPHSWRAPSSHALDQVSEMEFVDPASFHDDVG